MVTANRNGGGGSSGWWDGLPPRVRARFTAGPPAAEPEPPAVARRPTPPPADPWARDLARLGLAVLAVAAALVLFLLLAVSYISDARLALPGR